MDKDMNRDLDALLRMPLLDVSDDFTQQVMQRIAFLPMPQPQRRSGWLEKLQELILIVSGILGAAQLAAFMFGIWAAAVAG